MKNFDRFAKILKAIREFFSGQLDREYEADDDVELEDLPFYDERKPKQGMDTRKLDGRDHVTTWSESKKGQQFGLYVNTVDGQFRIFILC